MWPLTELRAELVSWASRGFGLRDHRSSLPSRTRKPTLDQSIASVGGGGKAAIVIELSGSSLGYEAVGLQTLAKSRSTDDSGKTFWRGNGGAHASSGRSAMESQDKQLQEAKELCSYRKGFGVNQAAEVMLKD